MFGSGLKVIEYDSKFTEFDLPNTLFAKIKDSTDILRLVMEQFTLSSRDQSGTRESFLKNHTMSVENKKFLDFATK